MLRTQEAIEQRLQQEYPHGVELYYVDYRDELSEDQVRDIIYGKDVDIFSEWYVDETVDEIINEVFTEEEQDDLDADTGDRRTIAEDWIYSNDTSEPMKQLCKNTGEARVRVQLHSNHDCGSSDWLTSQEGWCYEDSYLGDVLDFCEISPSEFKKLLVASGRKVVGKRPKKKHNPLVDPKELLGEMIETTAGWVLCFAGTIDLATVEIGEGVKKVEILKGTKVGCHNDWCGTCSMYDAETIRTIEVELDKQVGDDVVSLKYDGDGYGIDEICGMGSGFWKDTIGVLPIK